MMLLIRWHTAFESSLYASIATTSCISNNDNFRRNINVLTGSDCVCGGCCWFVWLSVAWCWVCGGGSWEFKSWYGEFYKRTKLCSKNYIKIRVKPLIKTNRARVTKYKLINKLIMTYKDIKALTMRHRIFFMLSALAL